MTIFPELGISFVVFFIFFVLCENLKMDLESLNFTELRDAEIVARMRKCNYEKFKTLVRMHLSFELDLNTDE